VPVRSRHLHLAVMPPSDSNSRTLGHFLTFIGPIVTMGGILAIWRTGDRDWFYVAFLPVGIAMWAAGFWLYHRKPKA